MNSVLRNRVVTTRKHTRFRDAPVLATDADTASISSGDCVGQIASDELNRIARNYRTGIHLQEHTGLPDLVRSEGIRSDDVVGDNQARIVVCSNTAGHDAVPCSGDAVCDERVVVVVVTVCSYADGPTGHKYADRRIGIEVCGRSSRYLHVANRVTGRSVACCNTTEPDCRRGGRGAVISHRQIACRAHSILASVDSYVICAIQPDHGPDYRTLDHSWSSDRSNRDIGI